MSSLPEREPFAAIGALERFLARVNPAVLPVMGQLVELLVAVLARVLVRASVRPLVVVHMAHLLEHFIAVGTFVGILAGIQMPVIGTPKRGTTNQTIWLQEVGFLHR